jgi:hypothetical protein
VVNRVANHELLAAAQRLHLVASKAPGTRVEVVKADVVTVLNGFWAASHRADESDARRDGALEAAISSLRAVQRGGSRRSCALVKSA